MLHPNQFAVNEAWIAFQLNETPIRTEMDGDFDVVALMDAGSCFILSNAFVPVGEAEPTRRDIRRLIGDAKAHKRQLPVTLFVPDEQFPGLAAEAERQGIGVVRVAEDQLLVFIAEARESFREHFGGGRGQ